MNQLDAKVLEITKTITEEWTKRTASEDQPFTSVQIVRVAEAVIATKMYQMLEGLEQTAASPDQPKVISIGVDWRQEMEWGLEEMSTDPEDDKLS